MSVSGLPSLTSPGKKLSAEEAYYLNNATAPVIDGTQRPHAFALTPEPITQEVMKIYLKNKAYKSILLTSETKAGDVCSMMAEKIGMAEFSNSLELIDCVKSTERRMDPAQNVLRIKRAWPIILGTSGNESEEFCRFIVVPKRGASEAVQTRYRAAMYGK